MRQENSEINQYRLKRLYGRSVLSSGNNGVFRVPYGLHFLSCVVSDGGRDGWEHVSVSCQFRRKKKWQTRTPNWDEMCFVKDMFWDENEVVIQFHPAKENYVNNHPHVLHLWRLLDGEFPLPRPEAVGLPGVEMDPNDPESAKIAARVFFAANRG
jgi:hypothetical protein